MNLRVEQLEPCLLPDGKTVMLTLTNYGYLLYTLNMLKSLKPFGITPLIICMDKRAQRILIEKGYHTVLVEGEAAFCAWNTKGYDSICYLKMQLIHHVLSLHHNILLVDGDIVFLQNPWTDIQQWTTGEVWIQNDAQHNENTTNLCTGYLFVRSTPNMIQLYDCTSIEGKQKYKKCAFDNNDQTYFNQFVKPYCQTNALPLEKYPNGKMFYEHVELRHHAVLVHFNWVHGHVKMAKMKEHKMWILVEEEE